MEIDIKYQTFERFSKICQEQGLNPCYQIEKMQLDYIANSLTFNDQIPYQIKNDSNSDLVRIVGRENNFIILDNGNKIHVFDFEKIYEGEPRSIFYSKIDPSVRGVLRSLENIGHHVHCFENNVTEKYCEEPAKDAVDPVAFLYSTSDTIKRIAEEIHNLSLPEDDYDLGPMDRVTITNRESLFGEINKAKIPDFEKFVGDDFKYQHTHEMDDMMYLNKEKIEDEEKINVGDRVIIDEEYIVTKIDSPNDALSRNIKKEKSFTEILTDARKNKLGEEFRDKEPNLSLGDKVTLDDGKDFYIVYKMDLDGAVWIRPLDSLSDTIYKSTYIDNLCRLKLIDVEGFTIGDYVTLDGGKDLYSIIEFDTENGNSIELRTKEDIIDKKINIKIRPIKDIFTTTIIEDCSRLKYEGSPDNNEINKHLDNIGFCNVNFGDCTNMYNAYSQNPLMIRNKNGMTFVDPTRLRILIGYLNSTTYDINKSEDTIKIRNFIEIVKIDQNI